MRGAGGADGGGTADRTGCGGDVPAAWKTTKAWDDTLRTTATQNNGENQKSLFWFIKNQVISLRNGRSWRAFTNVQRYPLRNSQSPTVKILKQPRVHNAAKKKVHDSPSQATSLCRCSLSFTNPLMSHLLQCPAGPNLDDSACIPILPTRLNPRTTSK